MLPNGYEQRAGDYDTAKLIVIAGVVLFSVVVIASVFLFIFAPPEKDSMPLIMVFVGQLGVLVTSLLGLRLSHETKTVAIRSAHTMRQHLEDNSRQLQEVHKQVDGKMSELLAATKTAATAEGRAQGAAETAAAVSTAVQASATAPVVLIPVLPPNGEKKTP